MKKSLLLVASGLLLAGSLVGCGEKGKSVNDVIVNFKDTLDSTYTVSYNVNFNTTVDAHGGTSNFSSFLRDVTLKATVELDLGSEKYLKVVSSYVDKDNPTTNFETTALLWKDATSGSYYSKVNDENATKVEDSDVLGTIDTLLKDATTTNAGWLDSGSLLYHVGKTYELNNVNLTDTFTTSDIPDPEMSVNDSEGLNIVYTPDYVGYKGDQGWFDLLNNDEESKAIIITDTDGTVLGFDETIDASLDLPIMTPAPTVNVKGSKKFTCDNGAPFVKEAGDLTIKTTASFKESENGTYEVTQFANGDWANMTKINDKDTLDTSKYLGIKPIPNEGYEVDKVLVNDKETAIVAAGWYCFTPSEGKNVIEVTFKKKEEAPKTSATVNVTNTAEVTYELKRLVGQNVAGMVTINDGKIDTSESGVFGVIAIKDSDKEEGKTYSVEVGGEATTLNIPSGGTTYYCFSVSGNNTYNVEIKKA